MSAIGRPPASVSGMPISSISGSATSVPCSLSASATDTDAGKAQPPARGDGRRLGIDQERAVLVEPSRGDLVDDLRRPGREPHQIAVAADQHLRHAGLARELGMLGKMQRFAMRRNEDFRPHPADHVEQFGAARMARTHEPDGCGR